MSQALPPNAYERQRRVARTLRDVGPMAPPALRARIEEAIERAEQRRRRFLSPQRLALAGALASAAIALAIVVPGRDGDATVAAAADLSLGDMSMPAPKPAAGRPQLLAARFEDVAFPNWGHKFGWHAVGMRTDDVGDRRAETVFYEHMGHQIGYTVVSGRPLAPPDDATHVSKNGVHVLLYRDPDGRQVAVFRRGGRTCVLSGHVMSRHTLVKLASWKGDGAVDFTA
ncbi:MAG TPA: hypothetical protein VGF25_04510 [Thermoleophilaceae bacterium]|jgi:hypothetical protein